MPKKKIFKKHYAVKIINKGRRCTLYIDEPEREEFKIYWNVTLFLDDEPFALALESRIYSKKKYTPSRIVGLYRDTELDFIFQDF